MDIIFELGLTSFQDYVTVLPLDVFSKVNVDTVQKALELYKFNYTNLVNTEESKFEYINRILMLKFSVFIDSIKDMDSLDVEGYRLEPLQV